jgi:hypothetical protein
MKTFIVLISTVTLATAQWPAPKAPAVTGADGYVEIPNAALAPTKNGSYRAILMRLARRKSRRNCYLR